MKKVDRLILSVAAGAAVLLYVARPRAGTVPARAANRAVQLRADAYRTILQRELIGSPEFWV
jgi:hypothetical protein